MRGVPLSWINVILGGAGRGNNSLSELRSLCRELGKQHDVNKVIIYGGKRYSGAKLGKKPIRITVNVWRKIERIPY